MYQKPLLGVKFLYILIFAGFTTCVSKPETPANNGLDPLDIEIRATSDYLNGRLAKGIKIVFLNFQSNCPAVSEYIIDGLIENTVNDGFFKAVDRQNLTLIQQEMNFQLSGEVSDESAQEIGKLLGAQTIVSGAITPLGSSYRLRVRAISVQSAEIQGQFNRDINKSRRLVELQENCGSTFTQTSYPAGNTPATPAVASSTQPASRQSNTLSINTVPSGVAIITYEKYTELRKLEIDNINTAPRRPLIFTQDGKGIIGFDSKSESNYIRLWNVETGKVERNIRVFSRETNVSPKYIAISPDGTMLITENNYSGKGIVLLWDIASGAYRECTGHTKQINALAFCPDGKYFVSASGDKTIKKWSAETGQEIQSIECDLGNDAVFSPDLRQIVTADSNRNIRILDATNGKTIRTISGIGYKLSYSPDGSRIAVFDERGRIRIIDVQSGREIFTLTGHESSNNVNLLFSPDGTRLISNSRDNIIIWNLSNGWELGRKNARSTYGRISSLAISSDGKYLAIAKDIASITIWGLE
jgi:WD40 repeat protein/TolB-like protein